MPRPPRARGATSNGVDGTNLAMEHGGPKPLAAQLPPVSRGSVRAQHRHAARKRDVQDGLALIRSELSNEVASLRKDLSSGSNSSCAGDAVEKLRQDTGDAVAELRKDIGCEVKGLRGEIRADIDDLKNLILEVMRPAPPQPLVASAQALPTPSQPSLAAQSVEKVVEAPQLMTQEVLQQVPCVFAQEVVRNVPVPQIQTVEQLVEVPQTHETVIPVPQVQIQEVDRHVPRVLPHEVVRQAPVPQVQTMEKVVEVPQTQALEKAVPVPQVVTQGAVRQAARPQTNIPLTPALPTASACSSTLSLHPALPTAKVDLYTLAQDVDELCPLVFGDDRPGFLLECESACLFMSSSGFAELGNLLGSDDDEPPVDELTMVPARPRAKMHDLRQPGGKEPVDGHGARHHEHTARFDAHPCALESAAVEPPDGTVITCGSCSFTVAFYHDDTLLCGCGAFVCHTCLEKKGHCSKCRGAAERYKTRICKWWLQGTCRYSCCAFAHGDHELRGQHQQGSNGSSLGRRTWPSRSHTSHMQAWPGTLAEIERCNGNVGSDASETVSEDDWFYDPADEL